MKKELIIKFDHEILESYKQHYFKQYPNRRKFDLKAACYSLNVFTAKIRTVQADDKKKYSEFVTYVLEKNSIPKLNLNKCHLTVRFYKKTKVRSDYDNACICLKYYLDAIVKYGLLEDDNYHIIDGVDLRIEYKKDIKENEVEYIFTYDE